MNSGMLIRMLCILALCIPALAFGDVCDVVDTKKLEELFALKVVQTVAVDKNQCRIETNNTSMRYVNLFVLNISSEEFWREQDTKVHEVAGGMGAAAFWMKSPPGMIAYDSGRRVQVTWTMVNDASPAQRQRFADYMRTILSRLPAATAPQR